MERPRCCQGDDPGKVETLTRRQGGCGKAKFLSNMLFGILVESLPIRRDRSIQARQEQ